MQVALKSIEMENHKSLQYFYLRNATKNVKIDMLYVQTKKTCPKFSIIIVYTYTMYGIRQL